YGMDIYEALLTHDDPIIRGEVWSRFEKTTLGFSSYKGEIKAFNQQLKTTYINCLNHDNPAIRISAFGYMSFVRKLLGKKEFRKHYMVKAEDDVTNVRL